MTKPRVGIILESLGKKNTPALRYALLKLNDLQTFCEFEIVYNVPQSHEFIDVANSRRKVERSEFVNAAKKFQEKLEVESANSYLGARDQEICDRYIAVCRCSVQNNYYLVTTGTRLRLLAIGGWERNMAPPSLLEFIVFSVIKQGIRASIANPKSHLASRGCLFDFNDNLENTRNAVLVGAICSECEGILSSNGEHAIDEVRSLLGGGWLGSPDDPFSAFSELGRLRFQPFQASGVQDAWWSGLRSKASESLIVELIKYIVLAGVLFAAVRLGLTQLVASIGGS